MAAIVFDIPFHCDTHLRFDESMVELGALGGLQISLTTLCLGLLYAFWFIESALRRGPVSAARPQANPGLMLYLGAAVMSMLFAVRKDLALFEVTLLIQSFLLYYYIIKNVRTRDDILFLATTLVASLLLHSLVMVAVLGLGRGFQVGPFRASIDGARVAGMLGSPNSAGSFVELLLAPCLALIIGRVRHWRSVLAYSAFAFGGIALVITFSRGSWLAGFSSVSAFCFIVWLRGWFPPKLTLTFALGAVIFAVACVGLVIERMSDEEAATADGRLLLIKLAASVISESPILGVGANNFAVVMGPHVTYPEFYGGWIHTVHNKFLLVWAETGILGLIGFLAFLLSSIKAGWRAWASQDRLLASLGLACALAIVGQMLHMNLDLFHSRPQVQLLWTICALLACISVSLQRTRTRSEPAASHVRRFA